MVTCPTVHYPSSERSKYSVNLKICSGDMLPSSLPSTLNPLLWSGLDAIINARDPMQYLGQTRIIYKPGQTRLIWTKCDPENPTRFQPWNTHIKVYTHIQTYTHIRTNVTHTHTHTHTRTNVHTHHTCIHTH